MKRLKHIAVIYGLLFWVFTTCTAGDNECPPLNLLESKCVGVDIAISGLTWQCHGTCVDFLFGKPVDIVQVLDTCSGEFSGSCEGIGGLPLGTEKLIDLQAISETAFNGVLQTKICSPFPELTCTLTTLPEKPEPAPSPTPLSLTQPPIPNECVRLNLLRSGCLGGDIVNSGLTWLCEAECTVPSSGTTIITQVLDSSGITNFSCVKIFFPQSNVALSNLQAITEVEFKGNAEIELCIPFPEMTCSLIVRAKTPEPTPSPTPPVVTPSPAVSPSPTPILTLSPTPTPLSSPVSTPSPSPTPGKLFTFQCEHDLERVFGSLEKLTLELGEDESCTLRLTNLEHGAFVDVSTNLRTGFRSSIRVSPVSGVTDANGELAFTISAINRGMDWVAWAVPNEDGKFEFNKRAYKEVRAWGMFVKVR